MKEVLLDSLLDSLKLVPFLFLSFVIMELIEHKMASNILSIILVLLS